MVVVMRQDATARQVADVVSTVEEWGCRTYLVDQGNRCMVGVIGTEQPGIASRLSSLDGVDAALPTSRPYSLASRELHSRNTHIPLLNGSTIGGEHLTIIAGPCSVEDRTQMLEIAHAVAEAGATALRGGAFKPRTSPYSFQGLAEHGLELLAEARSATGLPIVTEAMSTDQVRLVARYADVIQIGTRNMQNFPLLHAAGEVGLPVLLKRGMMSTIDEWLLAAEYILSHQNWQVILCERGIRTFESSTRNTTDINAVPVVKRLSHLPLIVDPSHSTGDWRYVSSVARAAVAAGADGVMIEVHPHPDEARSDGGQSLRPERFAALVKQLLRVTEVIGPKEWQNDAA